MTPRLLLVVLPLLLLAGRPVQAGPPAALKQRLATLEALETARRSALELIRDEARYVKDDREAQAEVDRRVAAVEQAYGRCEALLAGDARRLQKKQAAREALLTAAQERLNAWELALRQRLVDMAVLVENERLLAELPADRRPSPFQVEQVRLTNDYRLLLGLGALRLDVRLCAAAYGHSEEMRRLAYFDHGSPTSGQETPFARARLAGFGGSAVGENIASGYRSPRDVHRGWLHSPDHHRNIVDGDWEQLGVAPCGELWTQVFGRVTPSDS